MTPRGSAGCGAASCILAVLLALVLATAPDAQVPGRHAPRTLATGSASVAGVVVLDQERRPPLRRVTMTLRRAGSGDARTIATDDDGRYVFADLPAGVYTLAAARPGYVSLNYGARRVGLAGSPIPIAEGQRFLAEPIALMRGAVITGRLMKPSGQPVRGVRVAATQVMVIEGERRRRTFPGSAAMSVTDSRGTYRIFGLAPGDYVVAANATLASVGTAAREVTPAEIQWAEQQAAGALNTGYGSVGAGRGVPPRARPHAYASSYFPGTPDVSVANLISLGPGEERRRIDFPLLHVPSVTVAGQVVMPDGGPAGGAIVFRAPARPDYIVESGGVTRTYSTGADGRFMFPSLAPGEYRLDASLTPESASGPARTATRDAFWGRVELSVTGEDMRDLVIPLEPAMTIEGRVEFDGDSPRPRDLRQVSVRLVAYDAPPTATGRVASAAVGSTGEFTLRGVPPGVFRVVLVAPPAIADTWMPRSAMLAGRNVLDVPLEILPRQSHTDLVVTFTDRQTELSGVLVDRNGQPTPQFFLLVYPVDRGLWTSGSRWIKPARASVDGSYRITGLPAGDYFLCALTELDTDQQFDPGYLDQLVEASIKLTLAEGERRVQNLRVGGG